MTTVSALYVRTDSIYKELGVDCWDIQRDASKYNLHNPVVAHPPCRAWGKLFRFSNATEDEKQLAILAVDQVRKYGGVLEHPHGSMLWKEMNLPRPGSIDEFGGFTISVNQSWWNHPAEKKTLLYICGVNRKDIPAITLKFDAIEHTVSSRIHKKSGRRAKKELPKSQRDKTPIDFAKFLIEIAKLTRQ